LLKPLAHAVIVLDMIVRAMKNVRNQNDLTSFGV
jgi:hypothetical protein